MQSLGLRYRCFPQTVPWGEITHPYSKICAYSRIHNKDPLDVEDLCSICLLPVSVSTIKYSSWVLVVVYKISHFTGSSSYQGMESHFFKRGWLCDWFGAIECAGIDTVTSTNQGLKKPHSFFFYGSRNFSRCNQEKKLRRRWSGCCGTCGPLLPHSTTSQPAETELAAWQLNSGTWENVAEINRRIT